MALSFIYGPAGAGKSTYVQNFLIEESIREPKRNYFLIVPDQFTMQTQADVVKRHSAGGILNVDVLSFSRLAYRIFEETGKPEIPILDDTGKSLVLRHVAQNVSDAMPYMGKNLNKTGYIHEIKSSISEFMQYGISVKDLENISTKGGHGLFEGKIKDLSVIYDAFRKFNEGRFITGEEQLDILCEKLLWSNAIKDSVVVFDGFTGFTPVQERVIYRLIDLCRDVYITLTISGTEKLSETGSPEKLFYLSRTTANRLISNIDASKRGRDVEINSVGRFAGAEELDFLEKNLFRYPHEIYKNDCKNISLFKGENIRTEVDEVCVKILNLIRDEGYAYRDIAVVTGSLENYKDIFERRFKELGIPYFIDSTKGIVLNPFTEFIKSALSIIINNYSYDSVFHFLRSGFTDFEAGEIDRFDNYVRSLNIRGKAAYHKEFVKIQRDRFKDDRTDDSAILEVEKFNGLRQRLVDIMSTLERHSKTASDYVHNLYDFIKANNSYDKLRAFEEEFAINNDVARAVEYGQIYRLIMNLMDTIVSLVGDVEMGIDEFYKIFDSGISEISVGTIPANVDRIVVGDIERTRLKEVKALFFTGINDGNIPKSAGNTGILSEADREIFKGNGMELAPSPRDEMYRQKLYLYMNMCKPSNRLFLSYSGTDRDGKGLKAAYLIGVIKNLFPGLVGTDVYDRPDAEHITSLEDSYRHYASCVRKIALGIADEGERKLAEALYSVYKNSDNGFYNTLTDSAFREYVAAPLAGEIVDMIYGSIIQSSITRMEQFAGCAYAHFLKYGMELKSQADYDFNYADLGTIYHEVLDRFAAKLDENHLNWTDFSDEEGEKFIEEIVSDWVCTYSQGMFKDSARSEYTITKITRIMKRTIDTLRFQMQRGKFTGRAHEINFSSEYRLNNDKLLKLTGKVDRVDLYEKDGNVYVKIMDYKSGSRDVNITNVYFGLEQQMEVYMSQIIRNEAKFHPGKSVYPAAMLYYKLDNPIVEDGEDSDVRDNIYKKLKMTGVVAASDEVLRAIDDEYDTKSMVAPIKKLDDKISKTMLSGEEFQNMLDYSERMVLRIGNRVVDGDISISPFKGSKKNACEFCEYSGICRYDESVPGYNSRTDQNISDEKVREIVCGGSEDGDYLF